MTQSEADVRAFEREQKAEMMGVQRGVDRYRANYRRLVEKHGAAADGETTGGDRALMMMMGNLVPAIQAVQEESRAGIAAGGRSGQSDQWLLQTLAADKLAFITIRTSLTSLTPITTRVAYAIGTKIMAECEVEQFEQREAQRVKDAKEQGVDTPPDLYKLMKFYAKDASYAAFRRWRKKAEDYSRLEWTRTERITLGMYLLRVMVNQAGGWFEFRKATRAEIFQMKGNGGYTNAVPLILERTPECKRFLAEFRADEELNKPWLLPMVCKPMPWRPVAKA